MVDGEAQQSMDGVSMRYVFDAPEANGRRSTQYFEIGADRGVYHDGWFANTTPVMMPWVRKTRDTPHPGDYEWELYHLDTDFSQTENLALQFPEKLANLKQIFQEEALRNQVLPLQNSSGRERAAARGYFDSQRTELILWGADVQVGEALAPRIFNRSFSVEAEISIKDASGTGVIFAAGSHFGGWSFHLDDGYPVAVAASSPLLNGRNELKAAQRLGLGTFRIRWEVRYRGDNAHVLTLIDNNVIAEGVLPNRPAKMAGQGEFLESGRDSNVRVTDYDAGDGVFSGSIHKVKVALLNQN
jgi:arylsulfatase